MTKLKWDREATPDESARAVKSAGRTHELVKVIELIWFAPSGDGMRPAYLRVWRGGERVVILTKIGATEPLEGELLELKPDGTKRPMRYGDEWYYPMKRVERMVGAKRKKRRRRRHG